MQQTGSQKRQFALLYYTMTHFANELLLCVNLHLDRVLTTCHMGISCKYNNGDNLQVQYDLCKVDDALTDDSVVNRDRVDSDDEDCRKANKC